MTIQRDISTLEEQYALDLIQEPVDDKRAFLEIAKGGDQVFVTIVGDAAFAETSGFKAWRAAHRAMLKAVEVEDYSCAIQDLKEARDFAKGQLEQFYASYKQKIMAGLQKSGG